MANTSVIIKRAYRKSGKPNGYLIEFPEQDETIFLADEQWACFKGNLPAVVEFCRVSLVDMAQNDSPVLTGTWPEIWAS